MTNFWEYDLMMQLNHSGYISDSNDNKYAYEFKDGTLIFHFYNAPQLKNVNGIIGKGFDGHNYFFGTYSFFGFEDLTLFPCEYKLKPDYIVKNYKDNSSFNKASFSFDELQYFVPSNLAFKWEGDDFVFSSESKELLAFDVVIDDTTCHVSFDLVSKANGSLAKIKCETESVINISFDKTNDYDFLRKIYMTVDNVFAFICNRRNTTCLSMHLMGEYPTKGVKNGRVVDKNGQCVSCFYYINQYREKPESKQDIAKAYYSTKIMDHMDLLFQKVANEVSGVEDDGFSVQCIHPSLERRNLIDLQQSLQITSVFEYYVRHFTPPIVTEREHHRKMMELMDGIINDKTNNSKMRDLAKNIKSHILIAPSLEVKIIKVYNGYDKWDAIGPCIPEKFFPKDDISKLAKEVNEWRNELAHCKKGYTPSIDMVLCQDLVQIKMGDFSS